MAAVVKGLEVPICDIVNLLLDLHIGLNICLKRDIFIDLHFILKLTLFIYLSTLPGTRRISRELHQSNSYFMIQK